MIERYSRKEMVKIWSQEEKFNIWFQLEAHACDAQAELGVIPKKYAQMISPVPKMLDETFTSTSCCQSISTSHGNKNLCKSSKTYICCLRSLIIGH